MSNILGVDWGKKRIGLALGSEENKIAMPFDILENKEGFVGKLRKIMEDEEVYRLVIGLPLNLAGKREKKVEEVEGFIEILKQNFNLSIITEDERFSSKMVDALFREYRQKYRRDAIAAMLILQSYLDKIK